MTRIKTKHNTKGLKKVITKYLELVGLEEDPLEWFFSDGDIEHRIDRLTDCVLEFNLELKRRGVRQMFVYYYSLGKEEYDRDKESLGYGPLIHR